MHSDLRVLEEAQFEVHVHLDMVSLGAADSGDDDDQSLLTLELFHGSHLDVVEAVLLQL